MKKYLFLCLAIFLISAMLLTSCTGGGKDNNTDAPDEPTGETEAIEETKAEETEEIEEPKNAEELFKVLDKVELNAYEYDITGRLVMFVNGYKFTSTMTGKHMYEKTDSGLYSYDYTESNTECTELDFKSESKSIDAYNDGVAYISESLDGEEQRFCSEMSVEDYEEYLNEVDTPDIDFLDCTNSKFEKLDDGSFKLTLSGFTKKVITPFLKYSEIDAEIMGADILDLKIEVVADKDYMPKSVEFSFAFDVEETDTAVPEFVLAFNYVSTDSIKSEKPEINKDGYKVVDDVRILELITEELKAFGEQPEGRFTLSIQQLFRQGEQISTYAETDEITFGKINGAFYFDAKVVANSVPMTVSYKNAVKTVTQGEDVTMEYYTEAEARAYIKALINHPGYDESYATDLTMIEKNKYSIVLELPEENAYAELYNSLNGKCNSATVTVIATFDDNNKLIKLEGEAKVEGLVNDQTCILTAISVVEYKNVTNPEISA